MQVQPKHEGNIYHYLQINVSKRVKVVHPLLYMFLKQSETRILVPKLFLLESQVEAIILVA